MHFIYVCKNLLLTWKKIFGSVENCTFYSPIYLGLTSYDFWLKKYVTIQHTDNKQVTSKYNIIYTISKIKKRVTKNSLEKPFAFQKIDLVKKILKIIIEKKR